MNAVITYIFGKNTEILREPLIIDGNTEYICVTDQKNLRSKHYHIIQDAIPQATCTREKMVYVKYNPFKYTTADCICIIDGTVQITQSIFPLFGAAHTHPLLLKRHPLRTNVLIELIAWSQCRGLSQTSMQKFIALAVQECVDITQPPLIESNIMCIRNNDITHSLFKMVLAYMHYLGDDNALFLSNQCVLSYLLLKHRIKFVAFDQSRFFNRYAHNSWKPNPL